MTNLIERLSDGTYHMLSSGVFGCGCGSTGPEARAKLRMAGVGDIPIILTTQSKYAKAFIEQEGLNSMLPSLRKSKHSILYNPLTKQYIDLIKAPNNDQVYVNIYKVARGLV